MKYTNSLNNNHLISQNLTNKELLELYDKKYNLTSSDMKKYITAYDSIVGSLGCNKYKLTEGITNNKNKYKNILVDLFYKTIPSKIVNCYPIGIVFGIKQNGLEIQDLTKTDIFNIRSSFDIEAPECDSMNYFYQELQLYRSIYSKYAGNSYTYYIFKQLIKLFLTEVYLYNYQNNILTYTELIDFYNTLLYNNPNPSTIKSLSQLLESGEIKKVKYQCIKIMEPQDVNYLTISDLKIFLIEVNKIKDFQESYDTLIEKSFSNF